MKIRVNRGVGVDARRVSVGQQAFGLGRAMENFGQTVSNFSSNRMAEDRLQEARDAVQALTFERDENGNILPPQLPESNGFFGPSIYEEEYTSQALNRYKQEIALDGTKALQGIAADHPLDPDGFEAAADAYIQKTTESVLPEVRGDALDDLKVRTVGHFNHIVRQKSAFDFQNARNTHDRWTSEEFKTLTGLAASGADPSLLTGSMQKIRDLARTAVDSRFQGEGFIEATERLITDTVQKSAIATKLGEFPATDLGDGQAIAYLEGLMNGEGTIRVMENGKYVDKNIADMYPDPAERRAFIAPVQSWFADRARSRAQLRQIEFGQMNVEFSQWLIPNAHQRMLQGLPNGADQKDELGVWAERAAATGNWGLLREIGSVTDRDFLNGQNFADVQRRDNLTFGELSQIEETLQPLPEELLLQADRYYQAKFPESSIAAALNGEHDASLIEYHQLPGEIRAAVSLAAQQHSQSGGSMSRAMQNVYDQMRRRSEWAGRYRQEFVKNAGLTSSDQLSQDQLIDMERQIRERLGPMDVSQTAEMAEFADTYIAGMNNGQAPDWRGLSRDEGIYQIQQHMYELGVMPASLSNYMSSIVGGLGQGGNIDEFNKVMDWFGEITKSNTLAVNASKESALGRMYDALNFVKHSFPPSSRNDGEEVRAAINGILQGNRPYTGWGELPDALQADLSIRMDDILNDDDFSTFFDRRHTASNVPLEVGALADGPYTAPLPPELRSQVRQAMQYRVGFFDSNNDEQFDIAMRTTIDQVVRDNGYALSRISYNPMMMGNFPGWLGELTNERPHYAFSRMSPEALYRDGYGEVDRDKVDRIEAIANQTLKAFKGMSVDGQKLPDLVLGRNAFLAYDDLASQITGSHQYQIAVATQDGQSIFLPSEVSPEEAGFLQGSPFVISFDVQMDEIDRQRQKEAEALNEFSRMWRDNPRRTMR